MKPLLLSLLFALGLQADNINAELGYAPDFATAMQTAQTQNKPLLVMVVSTDCQWCRKMEKETLTDEEVAAFMGEKMTAYVMNKDTEKNDFLAKHPSPQVPTLYFVDPRSNELIFENLGYLKTETYLELVEEIVADYHEEGDE